MKKLDLYISQEAPNARNAVWLKPVSGGFTLLAMAKGRWIPLVLENAVSQEDTSDDISEKLIGSVQDKRSANTINGAKAFAKEAVKSVVGTSKDTSSDLTLNGLKAYIEEKTTNLS